ncbi:MAG: hypothetical protein LIO54_03765 [Oscillospiraceae bacterium]|nr:hypothetical protein [Oscillospiraceae bacterium]
MKVTKITEKEYDKTGTMIREKITEIREDAPLKEDTITGTWTKPYNPPNYYSATTVTPRISDPVTVTAHN